MTVQVQGKNDNDVKQLKDNFDELVEGELKRDERVKGKDKLSNKINEYKKESKKFDGGKRKNAKSILDEYEKWIKEHPDEEIQVYDKQIQKLNEAFLKL